MADLAGWRSIGGVNGKNTNAKSPMMAARQPLPGRYVGRAELAAIMAVSLATADRAVRARGAFGSRNGAFVHCRLVAKAGPGAR